MNSDLLVVVLSVIMLLGSFGIGLLPALLTASNKVMNLISILGAGLLVGVALIVIIPEGMITLNEALHPPEAHIHSEILDLAREKINISIADLTRLHIPSGDSEGPNVSLYLGFSLIAGFLIMLLIDQVFIILKERLSHKGDEDVYHELEDEEDKRQGCKHMQHSRVSQSNIPLKKSTSEQVTHKQNLVAEDPEGKIPLVKFS